MSRFNQPRSLPRWKRFVRVVFHRLFPRETEDDRAWAQVW